MGKKRVNAGISQKNLHLQIKRNPGEGNGMIRCLLNLDYVT